MYAVIETGGKQYRVQPGQTISVEKLAGDVGSSIEFGKVLAVAGEGNEVKTGTSLGNAKVSATIAAQDRGEKVIVFKFKRKKQYKRTIGHRQYRTRVTINEILV